MSPRFGQWIGSFSGDFPGFATFNLESDRVESGFACAIQQDGLPGSRIDFRIEVHGDRVRAVSTAIHAFDAKSQRLMLAEEYVAARPGEVEFSSQILVDAKHVGHELIGEWRGEPQSRGPFEFRLSNPDLLESPTDGTIRSWAEFKAFVSDQISSGRKMIYRGQSDHRWPLQTNFHRRGRFDLARYDNEVRDNLARAVNALSAHKFDVSNPSSHGSLLSLAQHHGFPTPLMDWTDSPYIAAFFAIDGEANASHSQVFALDETAWSAISPQVIYLADPTPAVSIKNFSGDYNPRHLPQQSVQVFTNISHVDSWIRLHERKGSQSLMTIVDIPRSERDHVLKDLRYMGVTAAALFPGLDGTCRTLRQSHFG